jgi:sulfate transport system ATP-binding protein
MSIEISGIVKTFGSFKALDKIDLDIRSGEMVGLLGPSGSGKTTLLRLIAGLETPDSGSIAFEGEDATDKSARSRQVGFVFQHYALFRHMTIFENVAFGLRVRPRAARPPNAEIKERVTRLLQMVQLESLAGRYPAQLSGGQRQRIALARALAVEPKVLLLDEPFGALDARVRQELRQWLRRLHDELHVTSVFVTHDQEEALEVSDRVVVMNHGRIEQLGTPQEVYDHPANPFVYSFLGSVNLFHGRAQDGEVRSGAFAFPAHGEAPLGDGAVVGYVRPHDLEIDRVQDGSATVEAVVLHINAVGPTVRLDLARGDTGERLSAEISRERYQELGLMVGERVHVRPRRLQVFADTAIDAAPSEDYSI